MRRFLIKLTYTVLPIWLVAVISVTVFSLIICPKFSGDIGRLALIPFGQEYDIELESKNPMPDRIFPIVDRVSDLKGTAEPLAATGTQYVLAVKDDVVGFYQATGTIPAGKAYIEYTGAAVKGFVLGNADGIDSLTGKSSPIEGGEMYDLSGRRVEKTTKGIYIINGKKVLK